LSFQAKSRLQPRYYAVIPREVEPLTIIPKLAVCLIVIPSLSRNRV
jgi:hypothetical protein